MGGQTSTIVISFHLSIAMTDEKIVRYGMLVSIITKLATPKFEPDTLHH